MNNKEILDVLGEILESDTNELLSLPKDTKLTDIGLESIKFIQFIVAIETKFNIEVLDSDLLINNFDTIEKLLLTLQKYFVSTSPKKVLICDCDNVLWDGVSGEETIYTNEDTNRLQETLVKLHDQGVLLCLCSKNLPENIDSAFRELDMPLKQHHITLSKINLKNKANNLLEISKELNLSTDSFVFIDDSDYEIGYINERLPEVTTIKVARNDQTLIKRLESGFNLISSDLNRTQLYREQKEREKDKQRFTDIQEYNISLETKIVCTLATTEDAARISELSMRTSQFNLSDVRYTQKEITSLIKNKTHTILVLSVIDKYGDMGIVSAAIIKSDTQPIIEAFFLSCRAFDRGFENVMIDKIKSLFADNIIGIFKDNSKNTRFSTFYENNGIIYNEKY